MSREEVMGVLAHELAHVKNRDILIGSIAATMAGAIMMLATMARWSAFLGGGGGNDDDSGGLGIIGLIVMSVLAPLGIAATNAPRFEPNPGLAAPFRAGGWLDAAQPATLTILRGPAYPSVLLLPVVGK